MKKKIIFIISVFSLFVGCQKTPTTTVIKDAHFDDEVLENETTESWEKMVTANIYTENVNETFMVGNKTITFKGKKVLPDRTDGLYTYKAVNTSYDEYFNNMDFLFGEYINDMYVPVDYFTGELEIGTKSVKCDNNLLIHMSIQNSRANGKDVMTSASKVYFWVDWNPRIADSEVPVNMTNDEAKKEADEIIDKIGVTGFEFEKCVYGHNPVSEGNEPRMDDITVVYRQHLQGIPVETYYSNNSQCQTAVTFVSRGISRVYIIEYAYEKIAKNSQCITYEEALECFKNYVNSCDYYDGAIFTEISFQYVIKVSYVDGENVRMVIPCYKFDTLLDPVLNNMYPDVYVDARDGKIYSEPYR